MTEIFSNKGAGYYNRALQRLVRTTTTDAYGAVAYTTAPDGNVYWANVQQTGSIEVAEENRLLTKTAAHIELRGWYMSITTLDRLVDTQWNEEYRITSIARGNDCMILEGYIV